jgi:hypothetical protein
MERLTLAHTRAPGDVLAMTALVRDVHRAYPGRFRIAVDTPYRDIWLHNPHVVPRDRGSPGRYMQLSYGKSIGRAGRECIHFLTAWHHNFHEHTGLRVPLTEPRPDLHLTPAERTTRLVGGRYWLLVAGGKNDFTTKHYVYERHQRVVDALRGLGIPVVQAGAADRGHSHPPMRGALNMVGKTTLRDFFRLIAQADGVICTITAAMHAAAALQRPCVVTAGGREEWWWEGYTNTADQFGPVASRRVTVPHRFLHTQGLLDCCRNRGCWKNKRSTAEADSRKSYCVLPVVSDGGQVAPKCMDMISAEMIVEAVLSYYADGTLPPVPGGTDVTPIAQDGHSFVDAAGRRLRVRVETVEAPPKSAPPAAAPAPPAPPLTN